MTSPSSSAPAAPLLTLVEARVLGVLIEKQRTVPDTYPLSLNALVAGCNQKTSRNPVMEVSEADAQEALDNLRHGDWVMEGSGSRVPRYAHNLGKVLRIPGPAEALLAVLMLRGPQTAAELRINCERLYRFADTSSVEAFLAELAERAAGALVVELPRQPGARENRWTHLLCGEPVIEAGAPVMAAAGTTPRAAVSREEFVALQEEVGALRAELVALRARLRDELGLDDAPGASA